MIIETSKKDVAWNYVGTIVSMSSGFVLLPLLLVFLSEEEIGLWYVYLAIAQLTYLFEFGFNPTFARNIVYCLSGGHESAKSPEGKSKDAGEVNIRLLARLMKSCKLVYAVISVATLAVIVVFGSIYIAYVARDIDPLSVWLSWIVIILSIFVNLYYLYALTYLRGFGDIEGENKAKVASRLTQIVVSGLLLVAGAGLISAAIGLLLNGVVMRSYALWRLRKRQPILAEARKCNEVVSRSELLETVKSIWHIAWRDGVVQISSFASSQAMSIVCSLFLGLAEAGVYSICSQFSGAVIQFANAFVKSYYPAFQAAFARGERDRMRDMLDRGLSVYYLGTLVGTVGVAACLLPLIPFVKPGYSIDVPYFLAMTIFNFFVSQYSIFCNLIVNTNRIPYVWSYLVSAVVSIALSCVLTAWFGLGMWGILLGQVVTQAAYNFWKWPKFMLDELETTLGSSLARGFAYWKAHLRRIRKGGVL